MAEMELEIPDADGGAPPQPPPEKPIRLKDSDRVKLDSIVRQMIKNQEPEKNIQFVVQDFKKKYGSIGDTPQPKNKTAKPLSIDWSKPQFQTMDITADQISEVASQPLPSRLERAQQNIQRSFSDIDDVIKDHLLDEEDKARAQQRQSMGIDNTSVANFIPPEIKQRDRQIKKQSIPQEVVESIKTDPNTQRFLIKKKIADYRKRGDDDSIKKLQASTYLIDADERAVGGKEKKVEENAAKIEAGELVYDVENGQLIKPLSFGNGLVHAFKNRNKDLSDATKLMAMNDEEGIKFLEDEYKKEDPDNPKPTPGIVSGLIGSEGVATAKSVGAGLIAGRFLSPAMANAVAAAASAPEMKNRAWIGEMRRAYPQLVNRIKSENPDWPEDEVKKKAYNQAYDLATKVAYSDMAANAAMTYTGFKLGATPLNFTPTRGVINAAKKITGATAEYVKKALPETLSTGALSATAQGVKNELANAAGAYRDSDEGIAEAAGLGAAMPLVIGAIIQSPSVAKKQFLHSFRKTPIEAVANTTAALVDEGAITPEQGEQVVAEVQQYQQKDAQVPENVSDEVSRMEVHDLMDEFNANKQKLAKPEEGGLHESAHKPIKERQKEIEWEINLRQQSPDDQTTLLKERRDDLQRQIDEHNTAKAEGKEGKLENVPAVKKKLSEFSKRLEDIQGKLDSSIYKASKIIKEGNIKGFSKDILEGAADDPEQLSVYLKDISEQLHDPSSRETAIDTYGKKLSSIIEEMFPAPKPPAVVMPGERTNVTETITIKPIDNAVQESSANEVDVRQQAGDGEAMGEGNIQPEVPTQEGQNTSQAQEGLGDVPPTTPAAGKGVHVERPNTELSMRGLQDVANEFGLNDVKARDTKTDLQLQKDAETTIKKWVEDGNYNARVDKLISGIEDGSKKVVSDEERLILQNHLGGLRDELASMPRNSPDFDAKFNAISRLVKAGEITRSEAGAALRVGDGGNRTINPTTIDDFLIAEQDAAGTTILTEQQKAAAFKDFDELTAAKAAYDAKIAKLEAENARLKAEKKIKAESPKARTRKTKEQFTEERKKIFTDIKEKLRKARQETSVVIVPFAKELIAIAPDVAKLVKNLLEEGVSKLDDIVVNIHSQLQEDMPGITEVDVRAVIAGEYNEKKPTRNALAEKLYNLKQEAKLQNRLDDLLKDTAAKSEKKQREANRELDELRQKIRSLEREKGLNESEKLQSVKSRTLKQIKDIEDAIARREYESPKAQPSKLDKEAQDLKDKLIAIKNEREVRLLKERYKNEDKYDKAKRLTLEVANVPRTVMSSVDLSALGRQGIVAATGNPVIAAKTFVASLKAAKSEKVFNRYFFDLKNAPDYKIMTDSRLALTDPLDPKLSAKEEAFMNNLAQKIPFFGRIIKGSERAYVLTLNKLRVDLFRKAIAAFEANGKTIDNNLDLYKAAATHINNITGRGNISGKMENAAPILNSIFFSPRLIASRVNLLTNWANPAFYRNVPAEVRKMYFKDMAKFSAFGASMVGVALLAGYDVELDARSSDFLKARDGDIRIDFMGGFGPYIRTLAQLITGKKITSTGKEKELDGSGAFGEDRGDIASRFARGKLAPVPALATDIITGRDIMGNEIEWEASFEEGKKKKTLPTAILKTLVPLVSEDYIRVWKNKDPESVALLLLSTFGAGVQDYGSGDARGSSGGGGSTREYEKRER